MSYAPKTILGRKTPEDNEYDEVRVIGQSEVVQSARAQEWSGQQADEYTIAPTSFGAVRVMAQGELERDYEVVRFPEEDDGLAAEVVEKPKLGPTPEEAFRKEANKVK